ncbi:physarolisin II. Serine peptidase. MEROPS family S53 [Jatrophihabitans endophyticus]|uniref:Physarolisin II. Serine peptidase. MEROPS family S53 n=1 Tax=Jatrophihabitans endophyticus TaxID=1206085 RepID=A0A1M5HWY4_9ACTN|nr:S53 family peptidase [Jatrophihabitans endophyticus]SHG20476.1 physarolisin II. Serine peptidase. MEROPS family S53 [Jatrophihabitans endophyticus]
MHRRGITAATITATTVLAAAVAAAGDASAAPTPQAVPHTKPAWTAHAKHLGHAKDSAAVQARVYLAPRGGLAALKRTATAIATPGNAQYGKVLTAAQYRARFAPTDGSVRAVSSYLRSQGLHVGAASAGKRYVTVTGSTKAAEQAFHTRIERYRHDGRTVSAPGKTLAVPASVKSAVLTVSGLDTTPRRNAPASTKSAPPSTGFRNARPCSRYYGQVKATYQADFKTKLPKYDNTTLSYAPCGYTGPQYRTAYEGTTTLTGKGVTVAITDAYASPTIAADAKRYAAEHGDAAYTGGQLYQTQPSAFTDETACDASGWYGEETLDVEAVHAMAPKAKIHYYASASCNDADFLDTLAQVVDDNDSKLVSNSWGDLEQNESADNVAAYEAVFLQGATEGISFLFSSGDNGDELANSGLKQADYPTSDPYVTSVGGTSDAIGADGKLLFQTGWGTEKLNLVNNKWSSIGFTSGAGGGSSALFNRPEYQDGATTSPYRQTPDIGLDADPNTGMLVGQTQTFTTGVQYDEYRIGGTSLASPLFAGLTALSLENNGGNGIGLLNPTIYANKTTAFTDVKGTPPDAGVVRVDYANSEDAKGGLLYSVRLFNRDSSLKLAKGYDNVTGVGAPNPKWLTALKRS